MADIPVKGKDTPVVMHLDRNGFGYTLNRATGELLVAEKFDPNVNWASKVDMKTGRPIVNAKYSPGTTGPDNDVKDICPAALGSKDEQPSSFDPKTKLMYVPTTLEGYLKAVSTKDGSELWKFKTAGLALGAQQAGADQRDGLLKVCADPSNLPLSNDRARVTITRLRTRWRRISS